MEADYQGFLDAMRIRTVSGWVYDRRNAESSVVVQIVINGEIAGFSVANQHREDLSAAGIGTGRHGFEFRVPDRIERIQSIDAYVANTSYCLQRTLLDFTLVNEPAEPDTAVTTTDGFKELLEPAFLNILMKRAIEGASQYQKNKPFPFICFDDFLPVRTLNSALRDFPEPERINWQHFDDGFTERKLAFWAAEILPPSLRAILYFLNSRPVLEALERLTGLDGLIPDPYFIGGGLHQIRVGGKLDIHVDFNRHHKLRLDRRLNLLLYLNKDWPETYGGHLELWNRDMSAAEAKILPGFNRCAIFNTTEWSYHGHPEPLKCPPNRTRKSLALYYYTNGRPEEEVAEPHLTVWKTRPDAAG